MAYPVDTVQILTYLGYEDVVDFVFSDAGGTLTLEWRHADPEPTDTYLTSQASDPGYMTYKAEHGGDPAATLKFKAKAELDAMNAKTIAAHAYSIAAQQDKVGNKSHAQLVADAKALIDSGKFN